MTSAFDKPTVRVYSPDALEITALFAVAVTAIVTSAIADAVMTPVEAAPNPASVCVANVVAPDLIVSVAVA